MGIKVQQVSHSQAARLAKLHKSCFQQSWGIAEFSRLLENQVVTGLMYLEDDRDIGLALLQSIAFETEILTFGIIPSRRGRGFGYGLLGGICDYARTIDSKAIFLEVSNSNPAGINLYTGYGFEQVGLRKKYYADRSDALIYRLPLTSAKL
ncbi:MAG: GNAT family N-acetyltransferase [Robiginitomaculum sp.]|nr:GNAT family N-acetyltransferase [Robiginitomaculum sp.]